jgi:hypothetical protein
MNVLEAFSKCPAVLRRSNAGHRRCGYVLVMTLGVVVIAAAVMVGVARVAMARIDASRQVQDDLQRRWGTVSCRKTLLPAAERILDAQANRDTDNPKPTPLARANVKLGGQRFDVVLADEAAKVNVNVLLRSQPVDRATEDIRKFLSGSGVANRLRIDVPGSGAPFVGSLGQLFPGVDISELLKPTAGVAPVDMVSCWGSGRVNLKRASAKVIEIVLGPDVSGAQAAAFVASRDGRRTRAGGTPPGEPTTPQIGSIDEILATWQLPPEAIERVRAKAAITSSTHSLWVTATGPRRSWTTVTAMTTNSSELDEAWYDSFEW